MFYPKLPPRATFPAILTALYDQRLTGFALLQLRNGVPIRVYKIDQAVDVDAPADPAPLPSLTDGQAPAS